MESTMTVALCIKCGAMKRGALTHCFECDFHPQEHEDMGKAMVLTDHFLSRGELEAISAQIKSGEPVIYPEEVVQGYAEWFAKIPKDQGPNWEDRIIFGFVLVMIVVTAVIVWLT